MCSKKLNCKFKLWRFCLCWRVADVQRCRAISNAISFERYKIRLTATAPKSTSPKKS